RAGAIRGNRAGVVERLTKRVDHAADQRVADGHLDDAAGGAHLVVLAELGIVAHDRHGDRVFFQREGDTKETRAGKLDQLQVAGAGEAVDARDAVGDADDRADARERGLGRLPRKILYAFTDYSRNLVRDCHDSSPL